MLRSKRRQCENTMEVDVTLRRSKRLAAANESSKMVDSVLRLFNVSPETQLGKHLLRAAHDVIDKAPKATINFHDDNLMEDVFIAVDEKYNELKHSYICDVNSLTQQEVSGDDDALIRWSEQNVSRDLHQFGCLQQPSLYHYSKVPLLFMDVKESFNTNLGLTKTNIYKKMDQCLKHGFPISFRNRLTNLKVDHYEFNQTNARVRVSNEGGEYTYDISWELRSPPLKFINNKPIFVVNDLKTLKIECITTNDSQKFILEIDLSQEEYIFNKNEELFTSSFSDTLIFELFRCLQGIAFGATFKSTDSDSQLPLLSSVRDFLHFKHTNLYLLLDILKHIDKDIPLPDHDFHHDFYKPPKSTIDSWRSLHNDTIIVSEDINNKEVELKTLKRKPRRTKEEINQEAQNTIQSINTISKQKQIKTSSQTVVESIQKEVSAKIDEEMRLLVEQAQTVFEFVNNDSFESNLEIDEKLLQYIEIFGSHIKSPTKESFEKVKNIILTKLEALKNESVDISAKGLDIKTADEFYKALATVKKDINDDKKAVATLESYVLKKIIDENARDELQAILEVEKNAMTAARKMLLLRKYKNDLSNLAIEYQNVQELEKQQLELETMQVKDMTETFTNNTMDASGKLRLKKDEFLKFLLHFEGLIINVYDLIIESNKDPHYVNVQLDYEKLFILFGFFDPKDDHHMEVLISKYLRDEETNESDESKQAKAADKRQEFLKNLHMCKKAGEYHLLTIQLTDLKLPKDDADNEFIHDQSFVPFKYANENLKHYKELLGYVSTPKRKQSGGGGSQDSILMQVVEIAHAITPAIDVNLDYTNLNNFNLLLNQLSKDTGDKYNNAKSIILLDYLKETFQVTEKTTTEEWDNILKRYNQVETITGGGNVESEKYITYKTDKKHKYRSHPLLNINLQNSNRFYEKYFKMLPRCKTGQIKRKKKST